MIARLAIIASAGLVSPLAVFGDEPILIPISEMADNALSENELLARCSGYFAAYDRYVFDVQEEPGLLTMFIEGAVWRAAAITLEIVGSEAQETTLAQIEAYDAAYLAAFLETGSDNISSLSDPRNKLATLDGDTCGIVMEEASLQVEDVLQ